MEKILLRDRFLKSRTALTVTVYLFSFLFCFLGARYIRVAELSYMHLALLSVTAFFVPLMLYNQSEACHNARTVHGFLKISYLPRIFLWLLGLVMVSLALFLLFGKTLTVYGFSFSYPDSIADRVGAVAAFVILPSVFEELVLRGAWQSEAEEKGVLGAVFASALMTASLGYQVHSCVYLLVGGLVFALVKAQSGSLYASLLIAMLWRAVMLLLFPLFGDTLLALPKRPLFIVLALVLGIAACFFALDRSKGVGEKCHGSGARIYFLGLSLCALALAAVSVILNGIMA